MSASSGSIYTTPTVSAPPSMAGREHPMKSSFGICSWEIARMSNVIEIFHLKNKLEARKNKLTGEIIKLYEKEIRLVREEEWEKLNELNYSLSELEFSISELEGSLLFRIRYLNFMIRSLNGEMNALKASARSGAEAIQQQEKIAKLSADLAENENELKLISNPLNELIELHKKTLQEYQALDTSIQARIAETSRKIAIQVKIRDMVQLKIAEIEKRFKI